MGLLSKEELLFQINSIRNKLILTGLSEGLSSKKTLVISEQLDRYICEYQKTVK